MKTRRIIALLLALVMICGVFAACGKKEEPAAPSTQGGTEEKKEEKKAFKDYNLDDWKAYADQLEKGGKDKYKFLYIPSWAASEYFVNSNDVWKAQYEERGWELDFIGPKEYTAESQLSTFESALTSGEYDGIILYPIDGNAFAAVKDDYWETYRTPVIIWGMAEKSNAGQYYIMADNRYELVGKYMGEMVIDYVNENKDYFDAKYPNGEIPVCYVEQQNNPAQNVRVESARATLDADGRFKTLFIDGNVSDSKAMEFAESWIMNYAADTEIMVMYNDPLCVSYINAIEGDTTTKFSDHLRFFGCDGTKAAAKIMQEDGKDGYMGGSAMSNHGLVGSCCANIFRVAVPAAAENIVVDGISAETIEIFTNGTEEFGPNSIKLTPANVFDYYPNAL